MDVPKIRKILFEPTDNTLIQLLRYTFVGGTAFIVDFGLLYVLTEYLNLHYLYSATLSFIAGVIVNYFLSKIWVFQKGKVSNRWIEFLIFALIGIIGLGFNNLFLWIFTDKLHIYYMISKILTTLIVYLWNFFARKLILFNGKK